MRKELFAGASLSYSEHVKAYIHASKHKEEVFSGNLNDVIKGVAKALSKYTLPRLIKETEGTYPRGFEVNSNVIVLITLRLEGKNVSGWKQYSLEWTLHSKASWFKGPHKALRDKKPSSTYSSMFSAPYVAVHKGEKGILGVRCLSQVRVWGDKYEHVIREPRFSPIIPWGPDSLRALKREIKYVQKGLKELSEVISEGEKELISLAFVEIWDEIRVPYNRLAYVIPRTKNWEETKRLVEDIIKHEEKARELSKKVFGLFTSKRLSYFTETFLFPYFQGSFGGVSEEEGKGEEGRQEEES